MNVPSRRTWRLQWQLFLGIGLIGAIIMGITALVISQRESQMLRDLVIEKYFLLTQFFAKTASDDLDRLQYTHLHEEIQENLKLHPDLLLVRVWNAQEILVASSEPGELQASQALLPKASGQLILKRKLPQPQTQEGGSEFQVHEFSRGTSSNPWFWQSAPAVYEMTQEIWHQGHKLGILKLQFSQTALQAQIVQTRNTILILGFCFLGAIVIFGGLVTRFFIEPLQHLTHEVDKLTPENLLTLAPIVEEISPLEQLEHIHVEEIKARTQEIQALQTAFIHMKRYLITSWREVEQKTQQIEKLNLGLEELVNQRTQALNQAMSRLKERDMTMQNELEVASDIQRSILPGTSLSVNGMKIVAHYQPMGKVGGDFYDVFRMQGGRLGVLIADVSGHGIPAALITVMAKISFAEAARRYVSPKDILLNVNDTLFKTITTMDYLTAFLLVINPTYEVAYSKASHREVLVWRHHTQKLEEWDTRGVFLGTFASEEVADRYSEAQQTLAFGDRLFLYTDGLIEACNPSGEQFGEKRLQEALIRGATQPLETAKHQLLEEWRSFLQGQAVNDDMTFMMIEVDPIYQKLLGYRELGRQLLQTSDWSRALTILQEALALDAQDALVHQLLGKCFFQQQLFEEAIRHLNHYLQVHYDDADSLYLLAEAYYQQQQYQMALRHAKTASQLRPKFKEALMVWALALQALGQENNALPIWERLMQLAPQDEAIRQAWQKIHQNLGLSETQD